MLRGLDNALMFTSTKEACLAACLNEVRLLADKQGQSINIHLSQPQCVICELFQGK